MDSAFSNPNSWISQRLRAGTPTGMEGQPRIVYYEDPPYDLYTGGLQQQGTVTQQNTTQPVQRVRYTGHNAYNMPGSLEAYQSRGIPPVMVQSDPYARIAYSYGPSGPIPLIGATSVYPHVVSSGDYDYAAPYRRTIVPVGGSLDAIMAHIERMAQLMRRGGGGAGGGGAGGGGAGGGTSKTPDKNKDKTTPTDDLALPPEGLVDPRLDIKAPLLRPNVPQLDLPAPLTEASQSGTTSTTKTAPDTMKYSWEWYPSSGFEEDVAVPEGQPRNYLGEVWNGATDWIMGKLRSMPRNIRPKQAPSSTYPVSPEATQPMLVPDTVPVVPTPQQYLIPPQTLSSAMALPIRRSGPSILMG